MKFPSPYGEVGFDLNNLFADVRKNNLYCFRPLTGKLVLITLSTSPTQNTITTFPSPYGEVGFDL